MKLVTEFLMLGGVNFYEESDNLILSEIHARPLRESLKRDGLGHVEVIPEGELLTQTQKENRKTRLSLGAVDTSGEIDFAISQG